MADLNIPSPNNYGNFGGYSVAHTFSVDDGGVVTQLRFSTNFGHTLPDRLSLYNVTLDELIQQFIVDDADWTDLGGGWYGCDVATVYGGTPYLPPGDVISYSIYNEASPWDCNFYSAASVVPDAGITYLGDFSEGGDTPNPDATNDGTRRGAWDLEITLGASDPGDPPPATNADLADWLDLVTGTQVNSAPLDTNARLRQLVLDSQARHTEALGIMGTAGAGPAAVTLFGRLLTVLGIVGTTADVLTATKLAIDTIGEWLDPNEAAPGVIVERLMAMQAMATANLVREQTGVGTGEWYVSFPEATFTGEAHVQNEADRFILHVGSWGELRPLNYVSGGLILYRLGWWAPIWPDGTMGERHFLSAQRNELRIPGTRLPGVLVSLWPEAQFTLEGWTYP